jgi:hypothetical protein
LEMQPLWSMLQPLVLLLLRLLVWALLRFR